MRDYRGQSAKTYTPAPGYLIGKNTTDKRPGHGGDRIDGTYDARIRRAPTRRGNYGDYGKSARENTGAAETGDGPAYDQGCRVRGGGADDGANLEQDDGNEVKQFDREERVQLAEVEIKRAYRQEVNAAVPAGVIDGAELVGDLRERRRDDGRVLCAREGR